MRGSTPTHQRDRLAPRDAKGAGATRQRERLKESRPRAQRTASACTRSATSRSASDDDQRAKRAAAAEDAPRGRASPSRRADAASSRPAATPMTRGGRERRRSNLVERPLIDAEVKLLDKLTRVSAHKRSSDDTRTSFVAGSNSRWHKFVSERRENRGRRHAQSRRAPARRW